MFVTGLRPGFTGGFAVRAYDLLYNTRVKQRPHLERPLGAQPGEALLDDTAAVALRRSSSKKLV